MASAHFVGITKSPALKRSGGRWGGERHQRAAIAEAMVLSALPSNRLFTNK